MNNELTSLLVNHLFINVAINLLIILVYRYFLINYESRMSHHPKLILILCSLSSIICMHYPVYITSGYIFDFRQVSFLLGSIIGGPVVSLLLFGEIVGYRYIIGGAGAITTVLVFAIMFAATQAVREFYWKQDTRRKLIIISGLSLLYSALVHFLVSHESVNGLNATLYGLLTALQLIMVLIVFYLIIQIKEHFQWIEEVNQSEKNRIVSQIAASISHEVRNPLTVIRGFVQLMATRQLDQEKLSAYCEMILAETDRAVMIINDYLSLAKAHDADSNQLVSVKMEVKYVVNVISPYALLLGVEIESNFETSEGQIIIDPYKLRQSLINLMKNAIEAMPHGGKLTILAEDRNGSALITIKDTGIGMSEEQLLRVGTPFYSTKSSGTGLGMMLVNHVVRSSGGNLTVHSVVGKGTDFELEFPLV